MNSKVKNVTFSLPIDLIEKLKEYAKKHYIQSINAGVKEALVDYTIRIEKEKLHKQMLEALKDPLFMKDLEDSIKAFEISDAETARGTQEW